MRGVAPAEAERTVRADRPSKTRRWTPVSALEFAGCDAIRMTLAEYEALGDDDKVEFFDSAAGLAWRVQEPVALQHEGPGRRLVAALERIGMTRGSPIRCIGAGGLRLLDAETGQVRAIHPDEMVFLHPESGTPGTRGLSEFRVRGQFCERESALGRAPGVGRHRKLVRRRHLELVHPGRRCVGGDRCR